MEGCKKAYNILQTATNSIVQEDGGIYFGGFAAGDSAVDAFNQTIIDKYEAKLKISKRCPMSYFLADECQLGSGYYYFLNGNQAISSIYPIYRATCVVLTDGMMIAFQFMNNRNGSVWWGTPPLSFIVDVNGKKKPNKYGRDIFIFAYDKNKKAVIPLNDNTNNDCHKDGNGLHCAYRIITEGKMNY